MKKVFVLTTILITVGLFLLITSQAAASPAEAPQKTKTPPGLVKTQTPPGQTKAHNKPVHLSGIITAVDTSSLTIEQRDGSSATVALTESTRIKIPSLGNRASVADLRVGSRVNIQARQDDNGLLTARIILVVPGKPAAAHHVGIVTAYQPGTSITIQDKKGATFTYALNEETKILPPERVDALTIGSWVTIIARRNVTAPTPTAQGIVVHPSK